MAEDGGSNRADVRSRPRNSPDNGRMRPPLRPGSLALGALPVAGVVLTGVAFWWIGVSVPLLLAGFDDTLALLRRMLPPDLPPAVNLLSAVVETLLIAIAGTGIATLVSLPLAFAASRSHGSAPLVRGAARLVIVLTRAVPTLVFALVFVRIFGLGPLAGGLAVAVHSVGMIAKLATDVVDDADPLPAEAVRACGARRWHVAVSTVLPRVLPSLVSIVLYRLDINIRASSVLGLVGAGGIGVALQTALGSLDYDRAAGIICVLIALILVLEMLSVGTRKRVGSTAPEQTTNGHVLPEAGGARYDVGWDRGRILRFAAVVATVVLFLVSVWSLEPTPQRLLDAWPNLRQLLTGMWPPAFSSDIVMGVLESLLMAIAAAFVGSAGGLVLALVTARTIAPSRPLAVAVRALVVVVRGVPDLVYALLFVAALGLGPFAGFLALWISCTALAAKFFTDSLEELDPIPRRALESVGATGPQAFLGATWPQFVPALTGNSLFVVDLALRESIVLGIVGAGGIGYLMQESVATLSYDVTSAIVIVIAVVVYAIETLAQAVRRQLLGR